jgi:hypothetical protein
MTISSFEQKREVAFSPPKEDETMSFLQEVFVDLFGLLTFQHRAILHDQSDQAGFQKLSTAPIYRRIPPHDIR